MVRDQYYVFTGPDGGAWCEMFWTDADGEAHHATTPTPYRDVNRAMARLEDLHPGAVVDQLMDADIAEALTHA